MNSILHPGLVSVTFRKLSVPEIVDLCVQAELEGIEWGGDIHVPVGDVRLAKETRRLSEDHGLQVAAYGSYYRLGTHAAPFEPVLETANVLGASTIRVWAGEIDSQDADASYWDDVIGESYQIAELAAACGISISYEFHPNTLTDTVESTMRLLQSVGHHNIRTLWQPPIGTTCDQNAAGLSKLLPRLGNVHVFYWHPEYERHLLADGASDWLTYLSLLRQDHQERYMLLEFVQNDSVDAFLQDAMTLKKWLL